jgi:hypothetical protein
VCRYCRAPLVTRGAGRRPAAPAGRAACPTSRHRPRRRTGYRRHVVGDMTSTAQIAHLLHRAVVPAYRQGDIGDSRSCSADRRATARRFPAHWTCPRATRRRRVRASSNANRATRSISSVV